MPLAHAVANAVFNATGGGYGVCRLHLNEFWLQSRQHKSTNANLVHTAISDHTCRAADGLFLYTQSPFSGYSGRYQLLCMQGWGLLDFIEILITYMNNYEF
jgi:hypothetical protein